MNGDGTCYIYDKESARISRLRAKANAFKAYGSICACCGEDRFDLLSIDHVDGDGAFERRKMPGGWVTYHNLHSRGYPPGYQVLCFNCNYAKRTLDKCPCQDLTTTTESVLRSLPNSFANARWAKGERVGSSKLTEKKVAEIRERYSKGVRGRGQRTLAREYGVSVSAIQSVVRGETWV